MRGFFFLILILFAFCFSAQELIDTISSAKESSLYDTDNLPANFFKSRRKALRSLMPKNSIVFVFSAPVRNRSNDVDFEYHQDPNMYYLSGYQEPHGVLVITKDEINVSGENVNELIYVQPHDESDAVWNGKRLGVQGAKNRLEIQSSFPNNEFKTLAVNLDDYDAVYVLKPENDVRNDPFDKSDLYNLMQQLTAKISEDKEDLIDDSKIKQWMAFLREVKTPEELVLMRKAIAITCEAQIELMKALKPTMKEYQAEAIVEYIFKKNGAEYPGFPTIMGSGENSCVLHYVSNRKEMKGSNLLVSDVGAEYHGYTADVSRTIPVDGHFSEQEAIIYNIVYDAQKAGIEASKAGNRFWDPNIAATTVISQRLLKLGIIKNPSELRRYFMHGTSHYLGLDVHDMGTYGELQPNTVITVEPGIYIPEGSPCDPKWWNIGVRIEDDVLITDGYPEVISDCVPKTIEEIEALMKQSSYLSD
ncbi:MAG: Xaa-Pro aminopeptidase [Crocinitomicaceae bacterium]|nr:Xaa-Pro aminopeptidase [Crocinitomicaceae bacterium]